MWGARYNSLRSHESSPIPRLCALTASAWNQQPTANGFGIISGYEKPKQKFRFSTSLLALDGTSSLALDSVPLFEPLRHRRICLRSWAVHWWYRLAASGRFRAGYLCSAYGCTELPRSHRSGSHNANVVGALGLGPQCAFSFGGNVRSDGPTMVVATVFAKPAAVPDIAPDHLHGPMPGLVHDRATRVSPPKRNPLRH